MGEQISGRHIVIVSLVLVLLLGFSLLYFLLLGGVKDDLHVVQEKLNQERQLLAALQERLVREEAAVVSHTDELQRLIPVHALVDQFMLDIIAAESTSNSFISAYRITEGGLTTSLFPRAAVEAEELEMDIEIEGEHEGTELQASEPYTPDGLKRLSVNLSVESNNYNQLLQFLSAIEGNERITKVDSLSFSYAQQESSPSNEEEEEDQPSQSSPRLSYDITISSFYADQLTELIDDLPVVQFANPANKSNPLVR